MPKGPVQWCIGHTGWVYSIAFAPDGQTIVTGSRDGTVKLWSIASGRELRTLDDDHTPVRSLALSADGALLAVGKTDGDITLWKMY